MWGEASDQNRAQMSHLALLGHYGQAGKNPPSYFPNSFSRTFVNKGKTKGRSCYAPAPFLFTPGPLP
jgi:hypothetical protein